MMPTQLKQNCMICQHAWHVGRNTGTPAACCDCKDSPHFRKFRDPHATCALWQAVEAGT
jgi:hypothetical protein